MNRLLGRRVLALAFRVQSLGFKHQGFCKGWDLGVRSSCGFARVPEGFYEGLGHSGIQGFWVWRVAV